MTDPREMTPQEREAFHVEAEKRIAMFNYEKPESDRVKNVVSLAKSNLIWGLVQVLKDGGENNMHYHTNSDTFWMVLKGRARFYGVGDKVMGEFGPHQGVLMTGGSRYWFEKVGDEDLELLQIAAFDGPMKNSRRINIDKHKDWMEEVTMVDMKVY